MYIKKSMIVTLVLVSFACCTVSAQMTSRAEAGQVAQNWVSLMANVRGDWAKSGTLTIGSVSELNRNDRLLAYYCEVEPSGYVVVSLLRGLAPVKFYSASSRLDIGSNEGPADLVKLLIERDLDEIESQLGPISAITSSSLESVLVMNHSPAWDRLSVSQMEFDAWVGAGIPKANYQEGGELLTSSWHQGNPYNIYLPAGHNGCAEPSCPVGCVATAGAQIMRYWSWPPGRDWINMPDSLTATSTAHQIDVTAEICHAVGVAVGMTYCSDGCESSASTEDMETVFELSQYGDCAVGRRKDFSWQDWWGGAGMIRDQLNANRPIQYRIVGHSIVCDGWREWFWGSYILEYHMNYGWNDNNNTWYVLDHLNYVGGGSYLDDYIVIGIVPWVSLGGIADITYPPIEGFPYRYIERDTYGVGAYFQPGQYIQFLQGVTLECMATPVRFHGLTGAEQRLYCSVPSRGIRIDNGYIVMSPNAEIKFSLDRQ